MKRLGVMLLSAFLLMTAVFGGAAFALEHEGREIPKEVSLPHVNGKLTIAQSVVLIVERLGLNIDHIRFVKEPKASDYFNHVDDDAPYAEHFIIAHHNGLSLDPDVDPEARITREYFAHLLFQAMMTKGEFAFIQIFILIHDEDKINPEYMDSIQKLIISNIIKLDGKGNFNPKDNVSLGQAYILLHGAVNFVKQAMPIQAVPVPEQEDVTMTVTKINDDINKVTLSWGEKPNPGYRIAIDRVEFSGDEAIIRYSLHYPDPDKFYPQVITEPTAETYVASPYQVVIRPSQGNAASSISGSEAAR